MISSALVYLWIACLLLLVLWLLVRRWRQQVEAGVWETAVKHQPFFPLNERAHHAIVAAMLFGGLLLILLGQATLAAVPDLGRWAVALLMAFGGGLFLWAGSRVRLDGLLDDWLAQQFHRAGYWLGVAGWQVVVMLVAAALAWLAYLAAGDQAVARRWDVSVVAWLLALAGCLVGGVSLAEWRSWLKNGLGMPRWEWGLLLALFVVAWLLRGTAVTQFPNTFSGDEGSAGLHAARFLAGLADNWFTIGWFSFPSLWYALQSVFIDLFGQTVEAMRYFSALGGALAVLATYWLARVMFDRTTAVAASVIMMGSHFHIHMSRIGLNNVWDSLFLALVLAGLWLGWRSGKRLPFVIAGLALGLGQYFYVSVRVLPLLVLIWVMGLWWRQPRPWQRRLPDFVLSGYTAVLTILPLAIYFAGHWAEFQAPLNRVTIIGERLDSMAVLQGASPVVIVLRQMWLAALGFTQIPLRLLYEPGVPLLLSLAAGLFLAGVAWSVLRFDGRSALLLLPLLSVVFLSGFSQDPPASQRFILAMPAVAVLVARPLGLVTGWLRLLWPGGKGWVWLGTAVILLWLALIDITFYFGDLYETYVLGGANTVVANDIAEYLQTEPTPPTVYFMGFPRMGYYSLSTIPYLAPDAEAIDVIEPITVPPTWAITDPTLAIFLPERLGELPFVQQAYPNGAYEEVLDAENQLLYGVYRISP